MSLLFDIEKHILKKAKESEFQYVEESDLLCVGFNTFLDKNNRVFEKRGEDLVEIVSDEILAEQRFIERHRNKN